MMEDRAVRPMVKFELHAAEEADERSGPLAKIGAFLDSKLGTALITFFFTVLLSAIITNWIALIDKDLDARIAKRADQAKHLTDIRALLANGLIDRATRASMVASALANAFPKSDIERSWQNYEQSYEDYNKMSFLVRSEANDLKPSRYKGSNPFLRTLDKPIEKSFSRLDRCIVAAYSGQPAKVTPDSGSPTLSCTSSVGRGSWNVADESQLLRSCVATYLILMDDTIWLKTRANDPDARPGLFTRLKEHFQGTKPCAPHGFGCWQRDAWANLPRKLQLACAPLDRSY